MKYRKSVANGFTLIELLVVIVIIGIISAIGAYYGNTYLKRARDGQREAQVQQIRSALEVFRADQKVYPSSDGSFNILGSGTLCSSAVSWGSSWTCGNPASTYMQTLPSDPSGGGYRYSSTGITYTIQACLEDSNASGPNIGSSTLGTCTSAKAYVLQNP